ncbi:hypothetical protein OAT67_06175 [Bacteriovoracaceae bacterium]|nr:hypothetical protein [Bacteriovoracaceae bacterium]
MLKLIKISFLIIIVLVGGLLFTKYQNTRTTILPLPFYFETPYQQSVEATNAQEADILIIGDRMAKSFMRGFPSIVTQLSKKLKDPLKVYDWSSDKEGIHRTLAKVRALERMPTVIIYLGGTQEFAEKTFEIKDSKRILGNFNSYEDDKKASLIMTAPILSRFLYRSVHYQKLEKSVTSRAPIEDSNGSRQVQDVMEVTYKMFHHQWKELLNIVKAKDGKLIAIAPPLNLEVVPKSVCSNSQTQNILIQQNEITKLVQEKRYKDAYKPARELSQIAVANSLSFYLLGKIHLGLGNTLKARQAFYKAGIFDCTLWRGNIIFNKMIVEEAETRGFEVIDFNLLINKNIGKNELFIDKIYPQPLFWERLNDNVYESLKRLLKL